MKTRLIYSITTVILGLAILQGTTSAQVVGAPERLLTGVWLVVTTPRNCTTGETFPALAFNSIWTFYDDGTMIASLPNSSTLTRSLAHGLWQRDLGWGNYSFKFVHNRTNNSTLAFAGKQESSGELVLNDIGDEFESAGFTQVYNVNGEPIPTIGCADSSGTRFKLD